MRFIEDNDLMMACVVLNAVGRTDLAKKIFDALAARRVLDRIGDHRLNELIDYATNYGEMKPEMPNGQMSSNGQPFTDLWRDSLLALLELRDRRGRNEGHEEEEDV